METKTPAELWLARSEKMDRRGHINAICPVCTKPIPVVGEGASNTSSDRLCQCGETTTIREVLEAHGLIELLPKMCYDFLPSDSENES